MAGARHSAWRQVGQMNGLGLTLCWGSPPADAQGIGEPLVVSSSAGSKQGRRITASEVAQPTPHLVAWE